MVKHGMYDKSSALGRVSFIRRLSQLATRLMTVFYGIRVGCDDAGNCYYRSRRSCDKREHRWVLYNGEPDPSRIPPEWFTWLHHTTATTLCDRPKHAWQRPHSPNMTGTPEAWQPGNLRSMSYHDTMPNNGVAVWTPAVLASSPAYDEQKR